MSVSTTNVKYSNLFGYLMNSLRTSNLFSETVKEEMNIFATPYFFMFQHNTVTVNVPVNLIVWDTFCPLNAFDIGY